MFWNLSSIFHAWPDLILQAAIAAAFSKLTVQDLRKLIPPEFYPSWVSFTQKQKLSFCLFLQPTFMLCNTAGTDTVFDMYSLNG